MEDSKEVYDLLLNLDSITRAKVTKKFSMLIASSNYEVRAIEKFHAAITKKEIMTENIFSVHMKPSLIRCYFIGTPEDVVEKIIKYVENLPSLPSVTLTKMLYSRLVKLEHKLKLHNKTLKEVSNQFEKYSLNTYERFFKKYGRDFLFRSIDLEDIPDFNELLPVLNSLNNFDITYVGSPITSTINIINDIRGLCLRKEMTTEIIRKAVGQLGVNIVMDC